MRIDKNVCAGSSASASAPLLESIPSNRDNVDYETPEAIAPVIKQVSTARLDQNVPNPFTHETVIGYSVPSTAKHASIKIVDVSGRVIHNFHLNIHESHIRIHDKHLTKGVYFYTLIVDGQRIDTKKMVVN